MLHLYWFSIGWIKFKSCRLVLIRLTKIFANWSNTIIVIFAIHHLEIMLEWIFNALSKTSFYWFWIYWLSSIPIIFYLLIVKCVILIAIRWRFIYIFQLISILFLTHILIKILFVLSMITMVVFTINHMCSVIKLWYSFVSWKISTIKKVN